MSFQSETTALEDIQNYGKLWAEYAEHKSKYVKNYKFSPNLVPPHSYGKWMTTIAYEAVSDQGPVWVQEGAFFQGSWKVVLND